MRSIVGGRGQVKRPPALEMLERAQRLRREMTPQEQILWRHLRGRRFEGFKFRRQMWLAGFIADFACPAARLVVEADGSQHAEDSAYDHARAAAFARIGWRTLRFWNNEIDRNLDGVLTSLAAALPSPSHPAAPGGPLPLPNWEREERSPSPSRGEGQPARRSRQGEGI